jgi:UDPglucose 6-dehydrogenase
MKIGFIGTGKLGLPVSLMYCSKGHDLLCYDVNPSFYTGGDPVNLLYPEELCPEKKMSLQKWFSENPLISKYRHTKSLEEILRSSDIIFVAVQTPHQKKYEGITRIPTERADFDYLYLKQSLQELSDVCNVIKKETIIVIISTVLPGTIRREILPTLSPYIHLCYNPYFIAMGTVAYDCMNPEFILLGNHNTEAANKVKEFYGTICSSKVFITTVENAELIKVCYNTFISTKIAMANTIMELSHNLPNTNCDAVIDALSMASDRLISPAYLRGGMGDGGGCHPRDNIALSWLSNKLGLSFNWFDNIMMAREKQTEFLTDLVIQKKNESGLPIVVLGLSFKPNTAIQTGSCAVLLCNLLTEKKQEFTTYDPISNNTTEVFSKPSVYIITCAHDAFTNLTFPVGSVIIDPHRRFTPVNKNETTYIPIGANM